MRAIWAMLVVSAALPITFGQLGGDGRQGRALLITMGLFLIAGVAIVYGAETSGNPLLAKLGVDASAGNVEGKEVRFGQALSALYIVATTGLSCGAVNAMHDSFTPLGGMVPMVMMQVGEVVFGGVGSGLYGMLVFALLAVFIAGLMIGRTPEYLGKKIESYEMKLTSVAILVTPLVVLLGTAIAVGAVAGKAGVANVVITVGMAGATTPVRRAGALVVAEAGGRVTDLRGRPALLEQPDWLASNGLVHEAMLAFRPFGD